MIFVLDSSGSVGEDNYQEVVNFTYKFVDQLDIGPTENQVGVVIYGHRGQTIFSLNDYSDKGEMLKAIDNIHYKGESTTNTADGLCLMLRGFSEKNGARLSEDNVFRLAVVMTDGHSNTVESDCNYTTTIEAAEAVHNFSHPILVFAIGVTDNVNDEELKAIASRDDYITYLENFNEYLFRETSDEQTYELCEKGKCSKMNILISHSWVAILIVYTALQSEIMLLIVDLCVMNNLLAYAATIPVNIGQQVGTLSRGGKVRYELQVPGGGVTVNLCVSIGSVLFYGSFTVPNPNSALHDYVQEVINNGGETTCADVFIQPEVVESPDTNRLGKRQADNDRGSPSNETTTTTILYISLEGGGDINTFVLETSEGDSTYNGKDTAVMVHVLIIRLASYIVISYL